MLIPSYRTRNLSPRIQSFTLHFILYFCQSPINKFSSSFKYYSSFSRVVMVRRSGQSKTKNVAVITIQCEEDSVEPLFDDLFDCVCNKHIDPLSCIPFKRFQDPTNSGFQKLLSLYEGYNEHSQSTDGPGIAMGTDTSIIVTFLISLFCLFRQHSVAKGLPEDKPQMSITQFET